MVRELVLVSYWMAIVVCYHGLLCIFFFLCPFKRCLFVNCFGLQWIRLWSFGLCAGFLSLSFFNDSLEVFVIYVPLVQCVCIFVFVSTCY